MRIKLLDNGDVQLWLSENDTYNWANQLNKRWPCSELAGKRLFAAFDNEGSLVDYSVDGKDNEALSAAELKVICCDFIGKKFPDHALLR